MSEESMKEKGRIWEQKRVCSYCDKDHSGEDLGFVHRNKKGNPDWSICFSCVKMFFDKVLGKKTKFIEIVDKCSYCDKQKTPYLSHYDKDDNLVWFICFDCMKKAFNNEFKNVKRI